MNITKSRIEYINSSKITNGTTSDFVYTMNLSPDEKYDKVCVLFANIPVSYYLVQAGYNTFEIQEGADIAEVTIPPGNYSVNSFISVVVPLINNASPNGWTYNMTVNNSFTNVADGKYYYTVSGNTSQPIFIFREWLYDQFGFNADSSNTFVSNALVSVNVLNFIPETTMYIYSNIVETKDNSTTNILQEFYGENSSNFSNIVYQCTSVEAYSKALNSKFSNSFTITLLDENGEVINLNGQPMFLTLLFYKSNDIFDIIKRFIKYYLLQEEN